MDNTYGDRLVDITSEMRGLRQELEIRRGGLDVSQPNLRDYGLDKRAQYESAQAAWSVETVVLERRLQALGYARLALTDNKLPEGAWRAGDVVEFTSQDRSRRLEAKVAGPSTEYPGSWEVEFADVETARLAYTECFRDGVKSPRTSYNARAMVLHGNVPTLDGMGVRV